MYFLNIIIDLRHPEEARSAVSKDAFFTRQHLISGLWRLLNSLDGPRPDRRYALTPAAAALCAVLVSGCGSSPGNPGILVGTTPPGASCTLTRLGQPIATVAPTPGIALVEPGAGDITILCSRQGFADAAITCRRAMQGRASARSCTAARPTTTGPRSISSSVRDRPGLRPGNRRTREKAPPSRRAPCALPQSSAPATTRSAVSSCPLVSGLSDRAITTLTAAATVPTSIGRP